MGYPIFPFSRNSFRQTLSPVRLSLHLMSALVAATNLFMENLEELSCADDIDSLTETGSFSR